MAKQTSPTKLTPRDVAHDAALNAAVWHGEPIDERVGIVADRIEAEDSCMLGLTVHRDESIWGPAIHAVETIARQFYAELID
jgi:hypothetical protein